MKELSGIKKFLFIGTLLLTTIVMMGDCLITPASDTLYKAFDNEAEVMYSATMGIGMSISTYAAMLIKGILGTDTFISMLSVLIGIAAVGTVLSIIFTLIEKKHPSAYYIDVREVEE